MFKTIYTALLILLSSQIGFAVADTNQSQQLDQKTLDFILATKKGHKIANEAYDAGDYETAYEFYSVLADKGLDIVEFRLARMYELGQGTEINLEKAAKLYESEVSKDNPEAMFYFARFHFNGLGGIPQDYKNGLRLWFNAAKLDHAESAYALGMAMYSVKKKDLGYLEVKRAALLDLPIAQLEMAKIILTGNAPEKESSMALAYAWAILAQKEHTQDAKEIQALIETNYDIDMNEQLKAMMDVMSAVENYKKN